MDIELQELLTAGSIRVLQLPGADNYATALSPAALIHAADAFLARLRVKGTERLARGLELPAAACKSEAQSGTERGRRQATRKALVEHIEIKLICTSKVKNYRRGKAGAQGYFGFRCPASLQHLAVAGGSSSPSNLVNVYLSLSSNYLRYFEEST